jgi:hypothetical protein
MISRECEGMSNQTSKDLIVKYFGAVICFVAISMLLPKLALSEEVERELKDGRIYIGQFGRKYPGAYGFHGRGTMLFTDGRRFEGRWINGYPSEGYLTGRSGKKTYLDYGWERGKFKGGALHRIAIKFEDGSRFEGEVDRQYNPIKGRFYDESNREISPREYDDLFNSNLFLSSGTTNNERIEIQADAGSEIIKYSSGTGFAINALGFLVTNSHVVNGCSKVEIFHKGETYNVKVLANDLVNDLALLKSDLISSQYFGIKTENSMMFDDIYAAGFPFGDSYSTSIKVTRGIISALTGIGNNYSQIQIDAALQPGNSGGPVFDKEGILVGVVVSKLSLNDVFKRFGVVPENQNFAIKANLVANLLEANSVEFDDKNNFGQGLQGIETATYHLSCWMERGKIKNIPAQRQVQNK